MFALEAETCSALSFYKTNKLIITLNVNEFLIIVMLRQEQNEIYTVERLVFWKNYGFCD
jgi:hypothetical protein